MGLLDNASRHLSHVIKAALPQLEPAGIEFSYLPPYSPELNAIEGVFRGIKDHDLAARRNATVAGLMDAVDEAFTAADARLITRHHREHQRYRAA